MNKKILLSIIIFIFISSAVTGTIFYLNSKKFNTIKENGVSFKYPKKVEIKNDGAIDSIGHFGYQVRTKFTHDLSSFNQSIINIVIPTKNIEKVSGGLYTLEDVLKANQIEDYNNSIKRC